MLSVEFYTRKNTLQIAKELIGCHLVSNIEGTIARGKIVEVEAYLGAEDRACHAFGHTKTQRNSTMFEQGGIAYVYLCYGMHALLNIVTHHANKPHAILIRAVEPDTSCQAIEERRKPWTCSQKQITSGPGRVTQAFGISVKHNGISLLGPTLWVESKVDTHEVIASKRIGIGYAKEDALLPYRFSLKNNKYVSFPPKKDEGIEC